MYTLAPQAYGSLASLRRLVGGNWTRRYYHFNALGTTDRITDDTQTVTDRYQLDPWGKVLATTGTTVNPFRFVGELGYYRYATSILTEASYVRARHYDPNFARWWSQDPLGVLGPDGANLYWYVRNRPTRLLDPTGMAGLTYTACCTFKVAGWPWESTSTIDSREVECDYGDTPTNCCKCAAGTWDTFFSASVGSCFPNADNPNPPSNCCNHSGFNAGCPPASGWHADSKGKVSDHIVNLYISCTQCNSGGNSGECTACCDYAYQLHQTLCNQMKPGSADQGGCNLAAKTAHLSCKGHCTGTGFS